VFGVVGHTEWVDFAVCERLPAPGEILHGRELFSAAGGGGAVAAVQLRKLAGEAFLITALGDDDAGRSARADLLRRELALEAATPPGTPQRRAFTYLTDDHERTITVLGERLVPGRERDQELAWELCDDAQAIYFTGGDAAALRAARGARVLVATPRAREAICAAQVQLDVLVASASDPGESVDGFDPPPKRVVLTAGAAGGSWTGVDGATGAWGAAALPGPALDAYGCGDSFAAGLTYGLGAGLAMADALDLAARCGAHCLTGRGPYGAQLTLG